MLRAKIDAQITAEHRLATEPKKTWCKQISFRKIQSNRRRVDLKEFYMKTILPNDFSGKLVQILQKLSQLISQKI